MFLPKGELYGKFSAFLLHVIVFIFKSISVHLTICIYDRERKAKKFLHLKWKHEKLLPQVPVVFYLVRKTLLEIYFIP